MEKKWKLDIVFPFWMAYAANLQIIRWSALQIFALTIFPLMMGLYFGYSWITHCHVFGILEAFVAVFILVFCMFFIPLMMLLNLFLVRRKNPLSIGPFRYIFDDEGIHVSGSAFGMLLKWTAIQKVRESGSFLFFFLSPKHAQAISVKQLGAAGILDNVRELAREKVANTKLRT